MGHGLHQLWAENILVLEALGIVREPPGRGVGRPNLQPRLCLSLTVGQVTPPL